MQREPPPPSCRPRRGKACRSWCRTRCTARGSCAIDDASDIEDACAAAARRRRRPACGRARRGRAPLLRRLRAGGGRCPRRGGSRSCMPGGAAPWPISPYQAVRALALRDVQGAGRECAPSEDRLRDVAAAYNVYVGPCIHAECFACGPDVYDRFAEAFGDVAVPEAGARGPARGRRLRRRARGRGWRTRLRCGGLHGLRHDRALVLLSRQAAACAGVTAPSHSQGTRWVPMGIEERYRRVAQQVAQTAAGSRARSGRGAPRRGLQDGRPVGRGGGAGRRRP